MMGRMPFCVGLPLKLHLTLGPGLKLPVMVFPHPSPSVSLMIKNLVLGPTISWSLYLKGSSARMTLVNSLCRAPWMSVSISQRFMTLNLVSCYLAILLYFPLSNKSRITAEPLKVSSLLKSTQFHTTSS